MTHIPPHWTHVVGDTDRTPSERVAYLRQKGVRVHPAHEHMFTALHLVKPQDVRVVILGQDPYHGSHNGLSEAHGLAFSVRPPCPIPPSLRNIFKEIQRDIYKENPMPCTNTDLTRWAEQGVLLWNTVLSVEDGKAKSHTHIGWQEMTRAILYAVAQRPVAALLWGKAAQDYAPLFHHPQHLVLTAAHPSPLSASRGFHGCGHFSLVNAWLERPIVW